MSLLTLPSPREEAWRWSDLAALPALAQGAHRGGVPEIGALWLGSDGPRLLFVDGVFDAAHSDPQGIVLGPVEAASEHPLGRHAAGEGWTLVLAAQQGVKAPVEIMHVATGGANHVAGRIRLDAGAHAALVETYVGEGWSNRLTRIDLGPSARLMRAVRLAQASGFQSLREEATLGEGARYGATFLGAGQADTRIDAAVGMEGKGGHAEIGGALLARGRQRHDAAIVVRHATEQGTSRQVWRAVAQDEAAASLAARVEVAPHAQKTDGAQSLRGLLLHRSAAINLKPELEIYADDVQCAHGATVGELDEKALFYMASRGIPPAAARALLTHAFVADALNRIGDETVRDAFLTDADAWLEETA